MLETIKEPRTPDNAVTMEINGATYIIKEFFMGNESINEIIAKRIKRELDPAIPNCDGG
jgi:uncharacterized protein YlzI (FlbEa/FlbD family)